MRNGNKNYNRITSHNEQNGHHQMSTNNKWWRRNAKKGNPQTLLVEMQIGAVTMDNNMEVPQKPKHRVTV